MKTVIKILISIIIIGALFVVVGLAMGDFNIANISASFYDDSDYVEVTKNTEYEATKIEVDADDRIIKLVRSADEKINVSYFEAEKDLVTYSEEGGTIELVSRYERKFWFFSFSRPSSTVRTITIEVPESFEGIIDIRTNNGSVSTEGLGSVASLSLRSSNGTITAKDMTIPGNVTMKTNNGKIIAEDLECQELRMETNNGKVLVKNIVASKVDGRSSNGDVSLDNITSSNIDGRTSNGDVDMTINGEYSEYEVDVETSVGSIKVQDIKVSSQTLNSGAPNKAKAITSNGSIDIEFI